MKQFYLVTLPDCGEMKQIEAETFDVCLRWNSPWVMCVNETCGNCSARHDACSVPCPRPPTCLCEFVHMPLSSLKHIWHCYTSLHPQALTPGGAGHKNPSHTHVVACPNPLSPSALSDGVELHTQSGKTVNVVAVLALLALILLSP